MRFYLQFLILSVTTLFFSLLNTGDLFSAIHYQQYSRGMNFIVINYSFSGDCFFAFTFMIIQVLENGSLPESVILHFEVRQNIHPVNEETGHYLISFNTAMMLTLCAVSAKYTSNRRTHLFLLVAVLLMDFCRICLVQEGVWIIQLAMPVSLAAFISADLLMESKRPGDFFKKAGTLTNVNRLPFSFH